MSAVIATDKIQGFATHDHRISEETITDQGAGSTDADFTQAGASAGVPAPDQQSAMVLEASGAQSDKGHLEVYTLRGGGPGLEEGGHLFRNVTLGDTASQKLGGDGYQVVTGVKSLFRSPGTGTGGSLPDVLRLADKTVLMAHQKASAASGVEIQQYDPATGAWSVLVAALSPLGTSHDQPCPALAQMSDGKVLVFLVNDDGRNLITVKAEPDFSAFNYGGVHVLRSDLPVGATIHQVRAAYSSDQIALFVMYDTGGANEIAQYASRDGGNHFDLISLTWTASANPDAMSLTALKGGGFMFVYEDGATPSRYQSTRIGSAYEDVQDTTPVVMIADNAGTTPTVSVWEDEDGIVYAYAQMSDGGASAATRLLRTLNRGDSWDQWGGPVAELDPAKTTNQLLDFAATSVGGRALLVSRYLASNDAESESAVVCLFMGGYSSMTVPATDEAVGGVPTVTTNFPDTAFIPWSQSDDNGKMGGLWISIEEPQNVGWTGTGAGVEAIQSDQRLRITTSGDARSFYREAAGDFRRAIVMFAVQLNAGDGDLATEEIAAKVRLADNGGYQYTVTVRLDDTGFRLYDDEAAATIADVTGLDLSTGTFYFAIILNGDGIDGDVLSFYAESTDVGHVRRWTRGPSSSLVNGGATANDNRVEFGHIATAVGSEISDWEFFGYNLWPYRWAALDDPDQRLAEAWNNNDLHPISYSVWPRLLEDDVRLAAKDGPSFIAETWQIRPKYEFGIENLHPQSNPSPRRGWRNLGDGVQQLIPWELDPDFGSARQMNHSLLVLVQNSNLGTIEVEGWDGAAWQSIVTLDATDDWTSLAYDRRGRTVIPRAGVSTTGERWFWHTAHVGDTFDLAGGESGNLHKITRNTEGAWLGNNSSTKKPTIVLADDNMPGALGAQAFGTGKIRRKDFGAIVHGYNLDYQFLRLRIPIQQTADDDYRIGQVFIGPIAAFAHEYDSGWSTIREFDSEVFRRRGGTRRARKRGPSRRLVEIAWSDTAIDASRVQDSQPDPNYVIGQTGTALAIGSPFDTLRTVEGIHEMQDGPVGLVTYLSRVPTDTDATHPLTDWREWVYGRLETNPRTDNVTGDEAKTELERMNTIAVREER